MFITPNDTGVISESDSVSIQNAVDEAKKSGVNRVVIPRINERTGKPQWDVDKAVILTSNLEIILDNCYIRQIDGSIDNVFTNHIYRQPDTMVAGQQENIRIVGKGNAVIDGGEPNGLSEFTSMKDGNPHISKNNPILLHNIRGLVIDNITIKNQRWWGINLLYVEKALLSNINIDAQNNIRNQDGIDIRAGCHDIVIENIWGQSGDDLIALSAIGTGERKLYGVEGKDSDIHDITIKNVVGTSAECAIVAIRNNDGNKMYNISVDGVYDTLNGIQNKNPGGGQIFEHRYEWQKNGAKSPYAAVRIGQGAFFKERNNIMGETYGISVKNVHARCNSPILLNATIKNSYFGNIYAGENARCVLSTKSSFIGQKFGADIKNVVFENIYYQNTKREDAVAFDLAVADGVNVLENVIIKNAFIGNCKKLLNMEHEGKIVFDGLYSDNIKDRVLKNEKSTVIINGKEY